MARAALVVAAAVVGGGGAGGGVEASWLPSIGPKMFEMGAQLPLYVNELTSVRTQTTLDHYQ